jgi:UTP--glucose-1-phosphate uridylyltransferase
MEIRKTVIPAAGFGTRMLPAAKAVPKEMLPVLDKPTIQYVVEEAAEAGINDALLITSREKRALEDHFDRAGELEDRLAAAGKYDLLTALRAVTAGVRVHAVRQGEQKGLGHAVLQARDHVGQEAFLCQLGDAIFSGGIGPAEQLVRAYEKFGTAVIGLEEVPVEKVERYGIVGGEMVAEGVIRIETLVEKPSRESAPSRLAIAARYVLTPYVFECLEKTQPGKGGEIQLTDAIKMMLGKERVHGVVLKARRHDIGNPVDWLKTNLIFARREPEMWRQIEPLVRSLMSNE